MDLQADDVPPLDDVPCSLWLTAQPERPPAAPDVAGLIRHAAVSPDRAVYIIGDPALVRLWSEVFTLRRDRPIRPGQLIRPDDIVVWLPGWTTDTTAVRDCLTLRRNVSGSNVTPLQVIAEW